MTAIKVYYALFVYLIFFFASAKKTVPQLHQTLLAFIKLTPNSGTAAFAVYF